MRVLITLIFIAASVIVCKSNGLCSQMQHVYQLCINERGGDVRSQEILKSRGKAGPRGPVGRPGLDAKVDYEVINSAMAEMFAEYKLEQEEKYRKLEEEVAELKKNLTSKKSKVDSRNNGLSTTYPETEIYCDLETDGGGWTVFQRRMDGSEDFYRDWDDYVHGFGNKSGEFWLGLDILHQLTSLKAVELRIDLEDWDGNKRYAKYSTFRVGDACSHYRVDTGGYTGDATDSFSRTNGMKFSTKDKDYDTWDENCAVTYKGAWWYDKCHASNLNGNYYTDGVHETYASGVDWSTWKGYHYSMKFTEMKIRPIA